MRVFAMELFTKLFGDLLLFVYHCFDRIVIHGYLSGLSRPEQVVHFFRKVVGVPVLSKEILSRRTADYQNWVEAFARNHNIPIEWAEKGVRKEDYVLPWLRRMTKRNAYGVYFIFKSMEQGPTFRVSVPKYPTKDPNHRILARQRSRFTHDYFYIRDEVLGPMVMRVATFFPFQTTYYLNGHNFIEQELNRAQVGFRKNDNAFLAIDDVAALQAAADRLSPDIIRKRLDYWTLILGPKFSVKERKQVKLSRFYAISQIEYCRNFIFKRNFPIHKLFERGCELGLWRLTAHKITEVFGARLHRRLPGKLATVIDQIEHGHHVFRAYFKHAFLKQYEKFATFLRNELCSNNLNDFGLKKGLDNLDAVRQTFKVITSRFAGFQAQWLNVHVDFPLLQRMALPITINGDLNNASRRCFELHIEARIRWQPPVGALGAPCPGCRQRRNDCPRHVRAAPADHVLMQCPELRLADRRRWHRCDVLRVTLDAKTRALAVLACLALFRRLWLPEQGTDAFTIAATGGPCVLPVTQQVSDCVAGQFACRSRSETCLRGPRATRGLHLGYTAVRKLRSLLQGKP